VKIPVKNFVCVLLTALLVLLAACPALAEEAGAFDYDAQLDALGKDELMQQVPEDARELMEETGVYDLSVGNLLGLSPRGFFGSCGGCLWKSCACR